MFRLTSAGLAAALTLAACTPEAPATPDTLDADASATTAEPGSSETMQARATAAGLSAEHLATLATAGSPVFVPVAPDGWTVRSVSVDPGIDGAEFPNYTLTYANTAGACVAVNAASEGLGGVFNDDPPNQRTVAVPGVPTDAPAVLGWSEASDTSEQWAGGRVQTEWFGSGMPQVNVGSSDADGCTNATPDEAEAILKSLRPLDPAAGQ